MHELHKRMDNANMGLFVPVVVRRKFMVYFGCLADIALVVTENYDRVENKKAEFLMLGFSNSLE